MTDYDKLHKEWDNVHFEYEAPTYQLRKKIILMIIDELFPDMKEYTCLDVGCGTGDYSFELLKRNFRVDGFDFSQFAIDKAQKKAEEFNLTKIQFQCDDIFKFTSEKKFDLIIISEVLEHLSDDLSILKKYSSFLKESGYIIVSVPFNQRLWSYEDEHAGHVRRYTQKRINELFSYAGMQMIKSICYGFPLIYMMWKIKSLKTTYSRRTTDSKINTHVRTLPIKYLGRLIVFIDSLFINLKNGVGIIVIARKRKYQFPVLH